MGVSLHNTFLPGRAFCPMTTLFGNSGGVQNHLSTVARLLLVRYRGNLSFLWVAHMPTMLWLLFLIPKKLQIKCYHAHCIIPVETTRDKFL